VSASVTLSFPIEFKKLLLLSIVENVLERVLVRNIPGIERCSLVPSSKPGAEPYLFVQGINFQVFESHPDKFDLKRIQTNHSYELKNRYGIEACRANLVKEIRSVFSVYGIDVDYRHLSLIADFVTFNGDYRAFNRIGMEESSSPFLKMSFETTMKYLISSASNRDTDWITSPSSAIVVGQPPPVGSNTFDLIQESF
jgi:DNA-directed RNA polymerase I subunit RPA1